MNWTAFTCALAIAITIIFVAIATSQPEASINQPPVIKLATDEAVRREYINMVVEGMHHGYRCGVFNLPVERCEFDLRKVLNNADLRTR